MKFSSSPWVPTKAEDEEPIETLYFHGYRLPVIQRFIGNTVCWLLLKHLQKQWCICYINCAAGEVLIMMFYHQRMLHTLSALTSWQFGMPFFTVKSNIILSSPHYKHLVNSDMIFGSMLNSGLAYFVPLMWLCRYWYLPFQILGTGLSNLDSRKKPKICKAQTCDVWNHKKRTEGSTWLAPY